MKNLSTLFLICLLAATLFTANTYAESEEKFLPIGLTDEEMTRLDEIGRDHRSTPPPVGVVRNPSEWEPSQGVIIRWPLGISVSLIASFSEDVMVTTIVSSGSQETSARNSYISGGVNMANTEFFHASTNTIWTRDYGPWFIFVDGQPGIVDPIYNRPRPQDDVIPQLLGAAWSIPVYGMDLATPGGNHMSDGLGMSMSTRLVYDENSSKTNDQVDSIMLAYLGNDYDVLGYIESGGIHHIDVWAKFLSPSTILVKNVPTGSASYALLNARADYLSHLTSAWGVTYNIVRIYCPYGTAYTNSLILDRKVYVPIFSNSWDANAIQVYENAMPGYEVLGFTGSWLDDDAIHCRAMGVPDLQTLTIDHMPLQTQDDSSASFMVTAEITDLSNTGLITDSLKVYYSVDGQPWEYVIMTPAVQLGAFDGYIPTQAGGTRVDYYVKAADNSGRVETHPFIGEPGAHNFAINTVNAAPQILSPDSIFTWSGQYIAFCPQISDPDDTAHTITYTNYPGWLSAQSDSLSGTSPDTGLVATFDVEVSDGQTSAYQEVSLYVSVCGDSNDDAHGPDVSDLGFLVDYLFRGGPPPALPSAADVDGSGGVDVADLSYLVDYLFRGGAAPSCL